MRGIEESGRVSGVSEKHIFAFCGETKIQDPKKRVVKRRTPGERE
jgi:hypothetical protein